MTLRYIIEVRARGRVYRYYRRAGQRIPLPSDCAMDDPRFLEAYAAAASTFAAPPVSATVKRGSVDQVAEVYLGSATFAALAANTRENRRGALRRFCKLLGDLPASAMRPVDVSRYLARLTPSAARSALKALRGAFGHAVQVGLCGDATEGVRLPRARSTRGHLTWGADQIEAALTAWPVGTWERQAFDALRWTGAARVDAVRIGRQNVRGDVLTYTRAKTGRDAHVRIGPGLRDTLDRSGGMLLLEKPGGGAYSSDAFGNRFNEAAREVVGPGYTCHGLRKAFTCWWLAHGATTAEVAIMLGDNIAELDRYAREIDRERIVRAMRG